ncbi:SSU ribosomal protein S5p (S2e) [Brevinematales bacterium NS]|jgi:small subunit ribosomal protein S5|nr:30S ribosomal protein S5 [Brevinematales bacterium]QJR22372.1 SSU ribosomal protein S5p (S2e) [Brevinematales bacterium NS]
MAENKVQAQEWQEKVVSIRRAAKVTTGGKRFRFNALVVVGNGKGMVGFGYGKANEMADAIRKAKDKAIKAAVKINLKGTTIPHEVIGKYKSGVVLLRPASKGTGVIAGGAVRPLLELVGIHDVLTKSLRSTNSINLVKATMNGLLKLMDIQEVAERRGLTVEKIFGKE